MNTEKEEELKSKTIRKIVGSVSFAEIVKIVHELAKREVDHQFGLMSEDEKEQMYEELCSQQTTDLSQLPENPIEREIYY